MRKPFLRLLDFFECHEILEQVRPLEPVTLLSLPTWFSFMDPTLTLPPTSRGRRLPASVPRSDPVAFRLNDGEIPRRFPSFEAAKAVTQPAPSLGKRLCEKKFATNLLTPFFSTILQQFKSLKPVTLLSILKWFGFTPDSGHIF